MFATASILMRIRHLGDGLPPTARRIATYIAEHAEEVIRMSITEVAEQTGASEGSIVGLCRRLDASGFQELKILLSRDLVEPMQMIHEDLRPSEAGHGCWECASCRRAFQLKFLGLLRPDGTTGTTTDTEHTDEGGGE